MMVTRELKLKLNKEQTKVLNEWIWYLSGVYNWAIRKIKLDAVEKKYYSKFTFKNMLANHSIKLGIPSHTISGILVQAWFAWDRYFKKLSNEPKLKSTRNKLNSIPFPDSISRTKLQNNRIKLPIIGSLKFYKQKLPDGKIKSARIIKKTSGWYLQLTFDHAHKFPIKETNEKIGIDTGFKYLAILSNGEKIENKRTFIKGQKRLAQAQRGKNKKLAARLHERIKNRRKDYNHKISRKIVEKYKEIYITNDNLRNQSKIFGKSVHDAGISQLRQFISYKSENHNRKFILVDSKNTTKTCGNCGSLTGPSGLHMLNVRVWECSTCGVVLDRDINSANVILKLGVGRTLVNLKF